MIDVVIFAVIAAVLVFKLWSQLGKRSDGEGGLDTFGFPPEPEAGAARKRKAAEKFSADTITDVEFSDIPKQAKIPDYADYGSAAAGLQAIKVADPYFDPAEFLQGAEAAFEIILESFAAGDKAALQPLLGKDLYGGFATAIDERTAKGETLKDTLIGVDKITITDARLSRGNAIITVAIHSQQVQAVYDSQGAVIDGDEQSAVQKIDVWVFERKIKSKDPNWQLMATDAGNA